MGRVVGVFGIRGEIKVDLLTDFPERFSPGSRLHMDGVPVTVERSRDAGRDRMIVKLHEIGTRTEAEALERDVTLDIREDDLTPLPEGAYYRFQLLGLEAYTNEGERLGSVEDVLVTGSNDVLVVRDIDGRPDLLIPNTPDIAHIDIDANRLIVHVIPGLIPEERPPTTARQRRRRR